jgi:hypothetical protein
MVRRFQLSCRKHARKPAVKNPNASIPDHATTVKKPARPATQARRSRRTVLTYATLPSSASPTYTRRKSPLTDPRSALSGDELPVHTVSCRLRTYTMITKPRAHVSTKCRKLWCRASKVPRQPATEGNGCFRACCALLCVLFLVVFLLMS